MSFDGAGKADLSADAMDALIRAISASLQRLQRGLLVLPFLPSRPPHSLESQVLHCRFNLSRRRDSSYEKALCRLPSRFHGNRSTPPILLRIGSFRRATETSGEGRVSLSGLTIQLAFANLTEMKAARQPFYVSSDDAPAKQKIVIAALDLFVRDGLCETSVRDIARASGFSNPALFKHFSSKEALAHYLFERCYLELFNLITRAILSGDTFATKQRAVIGAYMTALERDRNAVLYVQDNLRQFWPKMPITLRKHSIVGEVRTLLELGRKEGTVTATVDVGLLTVAWIGTLQQFARAQYFGEFKLPSRVIATTLEDLLTRMVKA
jgi:TetR/AcrR family transcriptional regulator, repressor of fatR-cypB operon